ncbi:MAG TPA: serine/threonine-protein kinase [Chthoniobacteraceae bacterium]|jgi:serine/threonine protein kinase
MAEASEPIIQECENCGALIDVSDEEPLSLMHCATCGAALRVRRLFNHFELQAVLGTGGMGAVYRAHDANLNRDVALKLLQREHSDNPALIESLASEASVTASINHPHVVKVYTTGTDHGIFFIAMELVDHGSLEELMAGGKKVPETDVLEIGVQIAEGLNAAWQRGLIHRDVKPGNILFARPGLAKIVDFGLAVLQEQANRDGGEIWATPYYVAPEKLRTPPMEDFRSDMYSLGATLFHALAGRPPHDAETASISSLERLKKEPVKLLAAAPQLSSATAYVIDKVLNHDPEQRHQSYEELIDHLRYARAEILKAKQPPASGRSAIRTEADEQRRMSRLTIAVATLVAVGGGFWVFGDQLLPSANSKREPPAQTSSSRDSAEARFHDALEKLLTGKYLDAAAELRALDAEATAPQPLRNWVTMHAGLALLLAEKPAEAQQEFGKLEQRGIYTPDPLEQKTAAFFVETARLAARLEPVAAADITSDLATSESFAWFLLALKNWNLGAFPEAAALLRQFQSAPLQERDAWIARYQPIATSYLIDLDLAQPALLAVEAAPTTEARRAALPLLQAIPAQLQLRGKLAAHCEAVAQRWQEQVAQEEQERSQREAGLVEQDRRVLRETMKSAAVCSAGMRFSQGSQIISATAVSSSWGKAERQAALQQMEWLAEFKSTLIKDLNTTGYTQPLVKKNGSYLPSGLQRATELQAEMVTPYGQVPVAWTDLAVESFAAIATSFLTAVTRPDEAADRTWRLGVFMHFSGKRAEALALLEKAAQTKVEYQPHLARFKDGAGSAVL